MTPHTPPSWLAHATRGPVVENEYPGWVGLLSGDHWHFQAMAGGAQLPDPLWTFWRSAAKPFQLLVAAEAAHARALLAKWPTQAVAIACASHSGTPSHRQWVDWLLLHGADVPLMPEGLSCGVHAPLDRAGQEAPWDSRHHNCSGKHAAQLVFCHRAGLPLENYLNAEHPFQHQQQTLLMAHLQAWAGSSVQAHWGTDGCGLPILATQPDALARSWRGLYHTAPGAVLLSAMTVHPLLVAGEGRLDTHLMRHAPWLVSKVGADGLVCILKRPEGDARAEVLVVKCLSGNNTIRDTVVVRLLLRLGWLPEQALATDPWLATTAEGHRTNQQGAVVGELATPWIETFEHAPTTTSSDLD